MQNINRVLTLTWVEKEKACLQKIKNKKKKTALGPAGLRRETFSAEGQPPDRTAQAQ